MAKYALITVLDSLNYTTMPYNEFILYRNQNYKDEKQIVLLTGSEILIPSNEIPSELEIYKVGKNPFKIRKALKAIVAYCRKNNIGWVLHMHSIRGSFSTALAMAGVMPYKCAVYTIHSTFTGYKFHNKVLSFMDAVFANNVTCVSQTSYRYFPNIIKFFKKERIQPLQNGVNKARIDEYLKSARPVESNDSFKIVYVARMVGLKNHVFLVDVAKRIKEMNVTNIKFIFVGEEEDNGKTRNYVEDCHVNELFEFTGLIPRDEVYGHLINSDLYVSSSTLEGLPISVLEGMYCGLPVVLSDIPQHVEVTAGCCAGFVLPYDVDKWAEKIISLSREATENLQKMGYACKEHVINNFTLEAMHNKYDKIYDKIRTY